MDEEFWKTQIKVKFELEKQNALCKQELEQCRQMMNYYKEQYLLMKKGYQNLVQFLMENGDKSHFVPEKLLRIEQSPVSPAQVSLSKEVVVSALVSQEQKGMALENYIQPFQTDFKKKNKSEEVLHSVKGKELNQGFEGLSSDIGDFDVEKSVGTPFKKSKSCNNFLKKPIKTNPIYSQPLTSLVASHKDKDTLNCEEKVD